MESKEKLAIMGQMFDALCLLIQTGDLQEADAVRFSAFYPLWQPGVTYNNNTWLRYGTNVQGKPLLWSTTRGNVSSREGAEPDVTPGSYRLLG